MVSGQGSASGLDFVIHYSIYCVQTHTWKNVISTSIYLKMSLLDQGLNMMVAKKLLEEQ